MTPQRFAEANSMFGPPPGMAESQVQTIHAFCGQLGKGSCDGAAIVVTAWKPDEAELKALQAGGMVFFSCLGGLPPHFLCTDFSTSTNIA